MICHNFDLCMVHSEVTPMIVFFNNCPLTTVCLMQFENKHSALVARCLTNGKHKKVWEIIDYLYSLSQRLFAKVSKCAKIRNRYNQVPHLTQDTNGKVTHSQ